MRVFRLYRNGIFACGHLIDVAGSQAFFRNKHVSVTKTCMLTPLIWQHCLHLPIAFTWYSRMSGVEILPFAEQASAELATNAVPGCLYIH